MIVRCLEKAYTVKIWGGVAEYLKAMNSEAKVRHSLIIYHYLKTIITFSRFVDYFLTISALPWMGQDFCQ